MTSRQYFWLIRSALGLTAPPEGSHSIWTEFKEEPLIRLLRFLVLTYDREYKRG